MKKTMFLALLTICLVLPITANANPPVDVQGDFTYLPSGECEEVRLANDNLIMRGCTDTGSWPEGAGDFVGTSTEVYDLVLHGSLGGFDYEYGWYKGTVTFDGTVAGKSGTMELLLVGTSPGDIADWSGTWRILSGTDGLANIHGNGVFWNNKLMDVHYEGQIH